MVSSLRTAMLAATLALGGLGVWGAAPARAQGFGIGGLGGQGFSLSINTGTVPYPSYGGIFGTPIYGYGGYYGYRLPSYGYSSYGYSSYGSYGGFGYGYRPYGGYAWPGGTYGYTVQRYGYVPYGGYRVGPYGVNYNFYRIRPGYRYRYW